MSLEELQEKIQELNKLIDDENQYRSNYMRQQQALGKLQEQVVKDQIKVYDDQLKALRDTVKSLNDLQTKVNETTKNTTKNLGDSFSSFAKAVASSSNDISKFSPSVSGAVKGLVSGTGLAVSRLTGVSSTSFLVMTSFNLLSVAASAFAESLVKYTDTIIKTSDTTATIGLAAGITSSQLEILGRSSGFSGDNLINFGNLLKKQGGNLIAFGGNVSAGANRFAEFIDVGEDQLAKYRRLGISQLQLAEYQGMYADNLLRSGTSISRNEEDQRKLRAASLQYRDILYSLSQITGDTLEEQQKAQEFAQSQSNFNASMAQRDMERIAIEDRMRTMADGAEKEELQATIDRMNMQDAVMRSFASFADPAKIGVEHATAIFESLAAGGDTMSEAIAKMAMMGFDVNAVSKEVLSFSGTAEEGTVLIADAMKDYQIAQDDFIARSGVMATNFGSVSQEYLVSVAGIVSASQNFATEIRRITREDLAKALQVTPDSDNLINLKNQTEELTRKFQELSSLIQTKLIDPLAGFAASGFETLNFLIDKIANPFRPEEEQQNSNQPSMMGATALTGGAAVGLGLGYVGMRTIANTYNALRKIGSPASGPTPTPTPTTAPPVTPSGTSNSPTTRVKNARGIWQTVPNSNYVPPAAPTPSPATGSSRGVPAPPGSSGGQTSRWTRFVSFVGTKSPRLLARLGPRLAAMAGMMAIPGPGWIAALISFGLNLTLAWELYNLWKEFSGSSDDTVEDSLNENSIPVTSMGSATNELAQSLAQLTGTDTEVGTIPTLTNSFDDLISTTDVLIEAFGSLRTSINSNNVSTASTTPRSFDSGTSGTNMQTASITPRATTRSFDSGTNISEQETKDFIIGNEGTRYEPYKDTLGNWTVGVGHLIGNDLPPEMNRRFSHQEVMDLFDSDYMHHRNAAERIPGFNRMDGLGQTALTDLTFNMGPSWINGWPNLANQLGEGDIPSAADNLRNSRWYDQVGNRGPRVANMIEDSTMLSAAQGGIASGPETGYLGKLHGTELIQPINSESVLSKLATTPESASDANINSNEIQTRMSEMYRSNMMLVETLNSKLDSMISKLEDGNYIQERILSNTV